MTDHDSNDARRSNRDVDDRGQPGEDRFSDWDAAYLLGSLSPTERREFEEHISGCARCASAVAGLAAMPGLLRALPAEDALAMLEADSAGGGMPPEPVPAGILKGLTARVRLRRRIRALRAGLVGVTAVAAIAVGVVAVSTALNPPAQPAISASLEQVKPSPLTADVELTSLEWGTKIEMSCEYHEGSSWDTGTTPSSRTRYGLYATDAAGTVTRVASWSAGPGDIVHATGSIDTPVSDVTHLDVRALDTGAVLLSLNIKRTAGTGFIPGNAPSHED